MNYVFFGNNVPLAERLRKALGTGVIECITLLQMKTRFFLPRKWIIVYSSRKQILR